tara:strand:+ start:333 stop:485 length:153 start_codon:yes stop_codon:yes gene_type:complete
MINYERIFYPKQIMDERYALDSFVERCPRTRFVDSVGAHKRGKAVTVAIL